MAEGFLGAALYNEAEIRKALVNYEASHNKALSLQNVLIQKAIDEYKPNWFYKLFSKGSLWDRYRFWRDEDCISEKSFHGWVMSDVISLYKGTLSEEHYLILSEHTHWYSGVVVTRESYRQIKNLFNGGKDVYLNPPQAAFVNYWKNLEDIK